MSWKSFSGSKAKVNHHHLLFYYLISLDVGYTVLLLLFLGGFEQNGKIHNDCCFLGLKIPVLLAFEMIPNRQRSKSISDE